MLALVLWHSSLFSVSVPRETHSVRRILFQTGKRRAFCTMRVRSG